MAPVVVTITGPLTTNTFKQALDSAAAAFAVATDATGNELILDSSGGDLPLEKWMPEAWAAGKYFTTGGHCSVGGRVYVATTGGTTASTPTGYGTGIVDGTVVWDFVGGHQVTITMPLGKGLKIRGLAGDGSDEIKGGYIPLVISADGGNVVVEDFTISNFAGRAFYVAKSKDCTVQRMNLVAQTLRQEAGDGTRYVAFGNGHAVDGTTFTHWFNLTSPLSIGSTIVANGQNNTGVIVVQDNVIDVEQNDGTMSDPLSDFYTLQSAYNGAGVYGLGDYVTNAGNLYRCSFSAGTHTASATPPTGFGVGILDGADIKWDYVGTPYASLAAARAACDWFTVPVATSGFTTDSSFFCRRNLIKGATGHGIISNEIWSKRIDIYENDIVLPSFTASNPGAPAGLNLFASPQVPATARAIGLWSGYSYANPDGKGRFIVHDNRIICNAAGQAGISIEILQRHGVASKQPFMSFVNNDIQSVGGNAYAVVVDRNDGVYVGQNKLRGQMMDCVTLGNRTSYYGATDSCSVVGNDMSAAVVAGKQVVLGKDTHVCVVAGKGLDEATVTDAGFDNKVMTV